MKCLALLLLLVGCTPQPSPVVPTPDASDAAVLGDAPQFTGPCAIACGRMQALGCVVLSDCSTVLPARLGARLVRNAKTGAALTCDDVAGAASAADLAAMGQPCGPQ